jgi:hypothetical protein
MNADPKEIIVATFPYHDRDGVLRFVDEHIEFQKADGSFVLAKDGGRKKSFRWKRPDPDRPGYWLFDVNGRPVLPYKLPEVIEAVAAGHRIVVPASESTVDLLWSWNVPATCGASGWTKAHAEYLRGADVVVVGDTDDAGRNFVRVVGTSLEGIARSVYVLEGIQDWAKKGGTVEAFHELVEREARPFEEPEDDLPTVHWHGEVDVRESRPWAVQDLIPEVGHGLISGQWGTYTKSH